MSSVESKAFESGIESTAAETLESNREIAAIKNLAKKAINYAGEKYQTAISFPNTREYYRQAHRDNKMIDTNTKAIENCEDKIAENIESGDYTPETLDRANSQIYSYAEGLKKDINLLKTTKVTAHDINNRGNVQIDWRPGGFARLK